MAVHTATVRAATGSRAASANTSEARAALPADRRDARTAGPVHCRRGYLRRWCPRGGPLHRTERHVTGLARAGVPAPVAPDDGGGAKAGADIDRDHRAPFRPDRRDRPDRDQIIRREVGERGRHRLEVVHDRDRPAVHQRRYLRAVDDPRIVGELDGVAVHRTGGGNRARIDLAQPAGIRSIGRKRIDERREVGGLENLDAIEAPSASAIAKRTLVPPTSATRRRGLMRRTVAANRSTPPGTAGANA